MANRVNGGQSELEDLAINGNPLYPGTGRLATIQQTKIGSGKYSFKGPYKNPEITGNPDDAYSVKHTNALSDDETPYNGKGTSDGIVNGVFGAFTNYKGGNIEDRLGVPSLPGSGRKAQIDANIGTWGYGPKEMGGESYKAPDTSKNIGQIII